MRHTLAVFLLGLWLVAQGQTLPVPDSKSWIARSDAYTRQLLAVQFRHAPEDGSQEGLAQYDQLIVNPTVKDELAARHEYQQVLRRVDAARASETDPKVKEDLDILHKAFDLQFRQQDFALRRLVPYVNASEVVFAGLRVLLDDQVAVPRRSAALVRLRRYAGMESGYRPIAELIKQRVRVQMALHDAVYPSRDELQTELGRNSSYLEGISALFKKYQLEGWETDYGRLAGQLQDYDKWVRATILPRARTDFRLPPEQYALNLEGFGVDIPPAKIAVTAHAAFRQIQGEMATLAAQIATAQHYPSSDYRAVIAQLKKNQITGEAIVPLYNHRLQQIEEIIRTSAAGDAAEPAGHHPPGNRRRDRAAAGAAHVAAAIPAQHRATRRIRIAAEHPFGHGRRRRPLRRLYFRCGGLDPDGA